MESEEGFAFSEIEVANLVRPLSDGWESTHTSSVFSVSHKTVVCSLHPPTFGHVDIMFLVFFCFFGDTFVHISHPVSPSS